MTHAELHAVRDLHKRIRDFERHNLRDDFVTVPKLDGLPHARRIRSPVEESVTRKLDCERELDELRAELQRRQEILSDELRRLLPASSTQTVMIMRYVDCRHFRDIAFEIEKSEATVFRLHRDGISQLGLLDSRQL